MSSQTILIPRLPVALGCLLLLGLAQGCQRSTTLEGAWHRLDLCQQEPSVAKISRHLKGVTPWQCAIGHLGPEEIRDPAIVHPSNFERIPHQPASEIQTLEQVVKTRLAWSVELGQEPYFSFIPLRNEAHPLPFVYRVAVQDEAGETTVLGEAEAPILVPPGQAVETVDLSAFAGRAVTLILELAPPRRMVRPTPRARGVWGSPAVYSRKPVDRPAAQANPNVLLIGVDTLRADALGAYGARPSVTPGLDRLASESDVYLNATTSFNVTNPSFVSLMTGLYGKNHGVYDLVTQIPEESVTLAERFQAAGFETLAVISAHHLGPQASGLGQGFQQVYLADHHHTAEYAADLTMDWIAGRRGPFFAWLHLFDPHTPHTPPAPYGYGFAPEQATGLAPTQGWSQFRNPGWPPYVHASLGGHRDLYTGEVAYMDRQVDRLLDFLDSRGLLENTIVVFVADHGENLEDHGVLYGHHGLWQTTTHVPLMIRWSGPRRPGQERPGRRLEALVQNVDLFPTLLAAASLEVEAADGIDLAKVNEDPTSGRRAAFTEHAHRSGARVRTRDFAYMISNGNPFVPDGAYLYDLQADPDETANLAGTGHPQEKELDRVLRAWLADRRGETKTLPTDLSEEDIQRLRALGYL